MPAYLLAVLSQRDVQLFKQAFPVVIDNSRLLRTFVQIVRSGASGRRSMGTSVKKQVQRWLTSRSADALLTPQLGRSHPWLISSKWLTRNRLMMPRRRCLLGLLASPAMRCNCRHGRGNLTKQNVSLAVLCRICRTRCSVACHCGRHMAGYRESGKLAGHPYEFSEFSAPRGV